MVSYTLHALTNILNSYYAHIYCYEKLLVLDNYDESQKTKVRYYLKKLRDKKFLSFMIFMADVLKSVSFFSKISQTRLLTVSQMEDTSSLCSHTSIVSFQIQAVGRYGRQEKNVESKHQRRFRIAMWKRLSAVILRGNATDYSR